METRTRVPAPEWVDADPKDWPPGVKLVYTILARVAERSTDEDRRARHNAQP